MLYLKYKILLITVFSILAISLPAYCEDLVATQKSAEELTTKVFVDKNSADPLPNFLLKLDYSAEKPSYLQMGSVYRLPLPAGKHALEVKYEQHDGSLPTVSARMDGESTIEQKVINTDVESGRFYRAAAKTFPLEGNFTVYTKFKTNSDGTLFMRNSIDGKWQKGGKTLAVKNGKLIYDVGWVGAIVSKRKVTNNKEHFAVVRSHEGKIELYLNGNLVGSKEILHTKDIANHVFQVSHGTNFVGKLSDGIVTNVRHWKRSIDGEELKDLTMGNVDQVNTPDENWHPKVNTTQYASDWLKGTAIALSLSLKKPLLRSSPPLFSHWIEWITLS